MLDGDGVADAVRVELGATHAAREEGLAACRQVIRLAGSSIRSVHRGAFDKAAATRAECLSVLRSAQSALASFPAVAHAGFLFDAEKEYAEACLTASFIAGSDLPSASDLDVGLTAWLNGLVEAASELRRHILDLLRDGSLPAASSMLSVMDDVYDLAVGVDFPDAVTGGLRRRTDALRAVLERTRSDLTTTTMQHRLQLALESRSSSL